MKKNQRLARRLPMQARALRTRSLIFETAVQILEHEGEGALTTNRIAELSGFSIGTVYQYFTDKHDILASLIAAERSERLARIAAELARPRRHDDAADLPARVRAVVRIVLDAFAGRHKARRILLARALRTSAGEVMKAPLAEIAHMLRTFADGPEQSRPLTAVEALVLVEAIAGAVRAAVLSDPRLLKSAAFEQALVDLAIGFFRQRRSAP